MKGPWALFGGVLLGFGLGTATTIVLLSDARMRLDAIERRLAAVIGSDSSTLRVDRLESREVIVRSTDGGASITMKTDDMCPELQLRKRGGSVTLRVDDDGAEVYVLNDSSVEAGDPLGYSASLVARPTSAGVGVKTYGPAGISATASLDAWEAKWGGQATIGLHRFHQRSSGEEIVHDVEAGRGSSPFMATLNLPGHSEECELALADATGRKRIALTVGGKETPNLRIMDRDGRVRSSVGRAVVAGDAGPAEDMFASFGQDGRLQWSVPSK